MESELAVFNGTKIRRVWDEKKEKWYFSVVDIVGVLIGQPDHKRAQSYWTTLKNRLKSEGSQIVTNCDQLKMFASDGKMYRTDVGDTEVLLRIIQSVPSPKAEPIKLWLAKVGYERVQDISDPERSLNRARDYWKRMGRSQKWIQQRMMGQEIRNKLTDYWSTHKITKQQEYAILTNIIHKEWSDLTVHEHKSLKGLEVQNLRDHMSDAELIFTALAELTTRNIAEKENATGMKQNIPPAKSGGKVARRARLDFEDKTGKKVVTGENFLLSVKSSRKLIK
jgi:DNA-damage-inducible protein D